MGRGKFKGKPTGRRHFSTPEQMFVKSSAGECGGTGCFRVSRGRLAGTSTRPRTFKREEAEIEDEISDVESEEESEKVKGAQGVIPIENPNLVKPKSLKARDVDIEKTTELSRREREEIEKQKAHERYMKLQEQGKKDLERLALIRQQRAEAAKKREEEKAAKENKKVEARK